MFYRYRQDRLQTVPLEDWWYGRDLFLVGGHPSLAEGPTLELLQQPGIVSMALNNAAKLFQPTMWIGADRAGCYCPSILGNPAILKFMAWHAEQKDGILPAIGTRPRQLPNLLLYTVTGKDVPLTYGDFCARERPEFTWWGSVFPLAVQVAYRLGFRRVFLVGCAFGGNPGPEHYAWGGSLSLQERHSSTQTYIRDVGYIQSLQPVWEAGGLQVTSCTPGSMAHMLPFQPLADAARESLARNLLPPAEGKLPHSSSFTF